MNGGPFKPGRGFKTLLVDLIVENNFRIQRPEDGTLNEEFNAMRYQVNKSIREAAPFYHLRNIFGDGYYGEGYNEDDKGYNCHEVGICVINNVNYVWLICVA
jgi:hypothetical protein